MKYDNTDDYIQDQIAEHEHIYHPALLEAYEKANVVKPICDWMDEQGVSEVNSIICEYDNFTKALMVLIDIHAQKIVNSQFVPNEDREAYWNYVADCCQIIGRKLLCNYDTYKNWKTDYK